MPRLSSARRRGGTAGRRDDYDPLAGALVAGHVLECGAQATGGNYSFFTEVPGWSTSGSRSPRSHADGSAVITKHPGTGGLVDIGTVTAQLLYEIGSPHLSRTQTCPRTSAASSSNTAADRSGPASPACAGSPPPQTTKVGVNTLGGFRNSMTFLLTGLDIEAKADLVKRQLAPALERHRHGRVVAVAYRPRRCRHQRAGGRTADRRGQGQRRQRRSAGRSPARRSRSRWPRTPARR